MGDELGADEPEHAPDDADARHGAEGHGPVSGGEPGDPKGRERREDQEDGDADEDPGDDQVRSRTPDRVTQRRYAAAGIALVAEQVEAAAEGVIEPDVQRLED